MDLASFLSMLFPYIVLFLLLYFLLIAPQRKREKQIKEMIASLKEGDEVVTIGGIVGKIVHLTDDEISLETGLERTKIKVARWSVRSVEKSNDEQEKNEKEQTDQKEQKESE